MGCLQQFLGMLQHVYSFFVSTSLLLRGWRRVAEGLVTVDKAIYVSNPTATPDSPLLRGECSAICLKPVLYCNKVTYESKSTMI